MKGRKLDAAFMWIDRKHEVGTQGNCRKCSRNLYNTGKQIPKWRNVAGVCGLVLAM